MVLLCFEIIFQLFLCNNKRICTLDSLSEFFFYQALQLDKEIDYIMLNCLLHLVKISNCPFKYLHEIKVIFENTSACQSGVLVGQFSAQNWGWVGGISLQNDPDKETVYTCTVHTWQQAIPWPRLTQHILSFQSHL